MTSVQLEQATKRFRHGGEIVIAVSEFSLTARTGETLVIVGPSGYGKTTLLQLMAGLEKQDFGHIYLDWMKEWPH